MALYVNNFNLENNKINVSGIDRYIVDSTMTTENIQSAIDDNKRIYFMPGEYTVNTTITIPDNCDIVFASDAVISSTDTEIRPTFTVSGNNVTIYGGSFNRNADATASNTTNLFRSPIFLVTGNYVSLNHMQCTGCGVPTFICFLSASSCSVDGCVVDNFRGCGVGVFDACTNIRVTNCSFTNGKTDDNCYYAYGFASGVTDYSGSTQVYVPQNIYVGNCVCENIPWEGLDTHCACNVVFENNVIHNCARFIYAYKDSRPTYASGVEECIGNYIIRNNRMYNDSTYAFPEVPSGYDDSRGSIYVASFKETPINRVTIENNFIMNPVYNTKYGLFTFVFTQNLRFINNRISATREYETNSRIVYPYYCYNFEISELIIDGFKFTSVGRIIRPYNSTGYVKNVFPIIAGGSYIGSAVEDSYFCHVITDGLAGPYVNSEHVTTDSSLFGMMEYERANTSGTPTGKFATANGLKTKVTNTQFVGSMNAGDNTVYLSGAYDYVVPGQYLSVTFADDSDNDNCRVIEVHRSSFEVSVNAPAGGNTTFTYTPQTWAFLPTS